MDRGTKEKYAVITKVARKTVVLALCYEKIRRAHCKQFGYRVFESDWKDVLTGNCSTQDTQKFKTFNTVREWMEASGWTITWRIKHWQGYVEFVFKKLFPPTVPQPGQFKNIFLLSEFVSCHKLGIYIKKSDEEMNKLYQRIFSMGARKIASRV